MYREQDIAQIAKRENNTKRSYVVVNPLQGKHVPVRPDKALSMFTSLGDILTSQYAGETLLLVGFAETATAIGAAIAVSMGCNYIQTTREQIPGADYLFFTESHSHATEQKLVRNGLAELLDKTDRIIFIEDEITTGNTILQIVELLRKQYGENVRFSAASILNGMTDEYFKRYEEMEIALHYLVHLIPESFPSRAESYQNDGTYIRGRASESSSVCQFLEIRNASYMDARCLVDGDAYGRACQDFWESIPSEKILSGARNILVLGTEEFMYPALFLADKIQQNSNVDRVCFHATTRSPIEVNKSVGYPLHSRYELRSLYDAGRVTYLYDLAEYDRVLLVTDARSDDILTGISTVLHALQASGNTTVYVIRWSE